MIEYEELKSAIEALEKGHGTAVDSWLLIDLAMERRVERFKQTLKAKRKFKGDVSKLEEAGYSLKELVDAISWRQRPQNAAIIRKCQAIEEEIGKERAVERFKAIIDVLMKCDGDREKVINAGLATSVEDIHCAVYWYNEDLRRRSQDTQQKIVPPKRKVRRA